MPFTIRPFRCALVQCSVIDNAGPFTGRGRRAWASAALRKASTLIEPLSRVLTNYLSMTDTQGPDTHRLVHKPSQAVQKGRPARPQQATRRSVPSAVR